MPITALPYIPGDWYWVVSGSNTQVYSSAAIAYVSVTDPAYLAWLAPGRVASVIAAEQDLWDALTTAGVNIPATATTSDAAKTALISGQLALVIGQTLFNHENRVRTLEGKATITKAQFLAGVKALLT